MVTCLKYIPGIHAEYLCTSSDEKPQDGVPINSKLTELDTNLIYYFHADHQWHPVGEEMNKFYFVVNGSIGESVTTDVTPNDLMEAITSNKTIYLSIFGFTTKVEPVIGTGGYYFITVPYLYDDSIQTVLGMATIYNGSASTPYTIKLFAFNVTIVQ